MQRISHTRRALALGLAAGAVAATLPVRAQSVTRLIVAFPPGGPVDFVARTISDALGKELGQQIIVETRQSTHAA